MSQKLVNTKDLRHEKGNVIALTRKVIKINKFVFHVESETKNDKFYIVLYLGDGPTSCNCPDYQNRGNFCKHMYAVMASVEKNTFIDETESKEILTIKKKLPYHGDEYTF